MSKFYKLYGDLNKWIYVSDFWDLQIKYPKKEAKRVLKKEPVRCIVDVCAQTSKTLGKNHVLCRVVMWCTGKKAVFASDITKEEKEQMLCGCVHVGCYADSAFWADVFLKSLLTEFSPTWQEQLRDVFGMSPYKADVRSLNGHVYALCQGKEVEIIP